MVNEMNQSSDINNTELTNNSNNNNNRRSAVLTTNNRQFININETDEISMDTGIDISSSITTRPITRSLTARQNQIDSKFQKPLAQTCQRLVTNEKPCNIIKILEKSSLTGKMPRCIANFPDITLGLISQRLKIFDYPFIIKRLDQLSITINFKNDSREANELLKLLKKLEYRLVHFERDSTGQIMNPHREEFEVEKINLESAALFRQYGGIEIFKRILLMSLIVSETAENSNYENKKLPVNLNLDNIDQQQQQQNISKRNSTHVPLDNNKKTKLSLNEQPINEVNMSSSVDTIVITENYSILKIKCKCIHILNRLICLPNFGKLVVHDLLYSNQTCSITTTTNGSKQSTNTEQNYDTALLQYLFSLLMFKDSRYLACQLIESILLHMPMLNLNRINNIKYILEKIDDEGLASICRIFAVTLSDLDMSEKKYWANAQKKQQQLQLIQKQQQQILNSSIDNNNNNNNSNISSSSSSPTSSNSVTKKHIQLPLSVRDQNQELLLNIPSLLNRLVNLVRCKDYAVRYPSKNTELEHWIRYIDEALSDTDEPETDSQNDLDILNDSLMMNDLNFLNPISNNNTNNDEIIRPSFDNQLFQPALLAATKLNNFVHVLYTLSLLLIGKERKRVQKSLAKLRLAAALNSLFDYLIWNCKCEYHNASAAGDANQAPPPRSHICPEVAVKIQFLRLVHSFCDHSEYKRVVLSKDEIEEILAYNKEIYPCLQVSEDVLKMEPRLRCTKEKVGLLSKIVFVIKQEPFSASFRFWLTRAIESFLRGGTSYADQMFLINRGIVEDTLQNILAINHNRPKEVLQSCFDMLGELIKFNTNGFDILNKQLIETDKFNMLLRMINQSLVDSNMFLRSIFLSIEFFENKQSVLDLKITSNKLLAHFDSFERRIVLLCRMINTINIHNLSQENVSCLNTTLVLLMLANRCNQLPKYLRSIKTKSIEMLVTGDLNTTFANPLNSNRTSNNNNTNSLSSHQASSSSNNMPLDLITNFRDLLIFWQSHYLQKDKDCIGLEQNSRIEFSYWKHTVELLLDTNPKNNCSLNYYLRNDISCLNATSKATRLDEYRCD